MTERDANNRAQGATGGDWPILRAQPRTFFKAPLCANLDELEADVAFIGMPFDQGTLGPAGRPLWPRRHPRRSPGLLLHRPLRAPAGGRGLLQHRGRR